MYIELDDQSVAFVMIVSYEGGLDSAERAFQRGLSGMNQQISPKDYEVLLPLERPREYAVAMETISAMMANEEINWSWVDRVHYAIDTWKVFGGIPQHQRRIVRVLKLSENKVRELRHVAASKRAEGTEDEGGSPEGGEAN